MPAAASWAFVTSVSALGIGCLVLLGATTPSGHLETLSRRPEFWAVLALAALGELWPVLRPGSTGPAEIMTSTMFSFAALLALGLPGAVVVQTLATVLAGLARRTSWWRLAFDVAVLTLALMVAWWALGRTGVADAPSTTVAPAVIDMLHVATSGLAYFTVTHALHWTAGVLARQQHLPGWFLHDAFYRSVVHATLIGLAPLVAVVAAFRWPLLPLFLLPLVAVHDNAARTAERNRAALRDPLTGLANRAMLLRRTREALEEADAAGHSAALFLLDLDRFRAVNDTLGHGAGDQILQLTAYRLEAALRPGDVVARLGGDEFAVLLPVVRDEAAAREIAERIRAALERACVVHDTHIDLDASVGIAMYPAHGSSFDELLQRADIAMYAAKTEQTAIEAYSPDRDPNSQH
ncbi:MAG: diguanylate cyclase domain-containing protein, partial [Actinomycetes bacterium]